MKPPIAKAALAVLAVLTMLGAPTITASTAAPAPSGGSRGFRLLAPTTTFAGRSLAELLILGYEAKVTASKSAIDTSICAERPQFGDTANAKAIAKMLFTLPAVLGKTMTCTMPASSTLMIDHIGVICNDSRDHQASVSCIEERFKPLRDYRVTIDGIDLGVGRFKLITEKFVVDLKRDSPFGLQAGKWRLRAGGWPLLVTHLSAGEHTILTTYKLGKNRQSTTVILTVTG